MLDSQCSIGVIFHQILIKHASEAPQELQPNHNIGQFMRHSVAKPTKAVCRYVAGEHDSRASHLLSDDVTVTSDCPYLSRW